MFAAYVANTNPVDQLLATTHWPRTFHVHRKTNCSRIKDKEGRKKKREERRGKGEERREKREEGKEKKKEEEILRHSGI